MGIEQDEAPGVVDDPTFALLEAGRECRVRVTWADGTAGPTIAFASRREAETWVTRDAPAWLVRLAATTGTAATRRDGRGAGTGPVGGPLPQRTRASSENEGVT